MNVYELNDILIKRINKSLPGEKAHLIMAPFKRPLTPINTNVQPKESAVMILISEIKKEACITLIQRPHYQGVHSNQIALPGGKKDETDINLQHTAERETLEEIGISTNQYSVLGNLSRLYIPPSNFYVYPFVSVSNEVLHFVPEKREVADIIQFPVSELLKTSLKKEQMITTNHGMHLKTNSYLFQNKIIWGATAMILSEFEHLLLTSD